MFAKKIDLQILKMTELQRFCTWKNIFKKFLNLCKVNKNCDHSANFQNFCKQFFLHGASLCGFHICFWYYSNLNWNDRYMARKLNKSVNSDFWFFKLWAHNINFLKKWQQQMNPPLDKPTTFYLVLPIYILEHIEISLNLFILLFEISLPKIGLLNHQFNTIF